MDFNQLLAHVVCSMNRKRFRLLTAVVCLSLSLITCAKSPRYLSDEDLAFSDQDQAGNKKQFYVTAAKPIEEVDIGALKFDIFKLNADSYPREILLYARIIDSTSGAFVTKLAPPDGAAQDKHWRHLEEKLDFSYVIRERDKTHVAITEFKVKEVGDEDHLPYAIMLTVDYSGSMQPVLPALYDATEHFIDLKRDYDILGLASFTKTLDVKVPLTTDKAKLLREYRAKREDNLGLYSSMFDGVAQSIALLDSQPTEASRVLVLFSDGDDNASNATAGKIIDLAKKSKVTIFTVGFGYSKDSVLSALSEYTGGRSYRAKSKKELASIFEDIYRSLRNYYIVSYKPPEHAGVHVVKLGFLPAQGTDQIFAEAKYDKSDINPFNADSSGIFEKRIVFDFGQSTMKPESQIITIEIADALLRNPRVRLEVRGNTDNVGGEEFNQRLSEARAQAVVNELVRHRVDERRLRPRGFGMSQPRVPNDTEENRAINRRTEFVIIAR